MLRPPEHAELAALIQRMNRLREGMLEREVHLRRDGHAVTLLASATALKGPEGAYLGMVLVFDDLTELLKAQRLAAWREVAQRIAHEIKNPLTPIQLSAQRLRRRLSTDRSPDGEAAARGGDGHHRPGGRRAEAARGRVLALRADARAPAPRHGPRRACSRAWSSSTASRTRASPSRRPSRPTCRRVEVDPDQIKRAVLNLVDNAVEAVGGAGEVTVETIWLPESRRARIVVADDGPGIPAEDKDRLFLPYFSTKATGTGLGPAHRAPDRHRPRRHHLGRGRRAAGHALRDRAARWAASAVAPVEA